MDKKSSKGDFPMTDIQKYREALYRFCKGKQRMCVPAQHDDDDMLISQALDKLELQAEENKRLREALEWYADKKNWQLRVTITMGSAHPHHEPIKSDKGERARTALSSIQGD